jgi:undecaprenyl-diphosphatase
MLHLLVHIDTALFLVCNHAIANPAFDAIFTTITNGRFWIVPGIIAAVVFLYFKKKTAAMVITLMLVTVSVSDPVCNRIIKPLFPRMRPCNERVHIDGARFLLGRKGSPSFPSSHAMNMFAQATLLTLLYRRKRVGITAFSFAAVIGFSRIYVGVHYPFDVLAGAMFGMMVGIAVYGVYCFVKAKYACAAGQGWKN